MIFSSSVVADLAVIMTIAAAVGFLLLSGRNSP